MCAFYCVLKNIVKKNKTELPNYISIFWQNITKKLRSASSSPDNQQSNTHTHTRLTALCPGLPRWAGTRKVKPIWILLKQETVSGSGFSWAICKSAPHSRQTTMPPPHHSVFYRPDALPAAQPTASKHWTCKFWRCRQSTTQHVCILLTGLSELIAREKRRHGILVKLRLGQDLWSVRHPGMGHPAPLWCWYVRDGHTAHRDLGTWCTVYRTPVNPPVRAIQ